MSYGRIYKTHILGQRTIRVTGAHNVATILKGEGTLVETQWPPSTKLILGSGALAHSQVLDKNIACIITDVPKPKLYITFSPKGN